MQDIGLSEKAGEDQGGEFATYLLRVRGVEKTFGNTRALRQVDFTVRPAEIMGLMGGNGAGKSTLAKVIGGLLVPDGGDIDLLGTRLDSGHRPRDAMRLGLRFVHQELSLCSNLRVFENFAIELPDLIEGARWKTRALEFASAAIAAVFPGNSIDPRAKVEALSISQRQMVEIARALGHPGTRLVVLDEPTSSLGSREAEQLRAYMKLRRSEGTSFIFVSHRLHETLELADRITVLRNGVVAWAGDSTGVSRDELVSLLGGANVPLRDEPPTGDVSASGKSAAVAIEGLSGSLLKNVSLSAGTGEILGLAGLEASGQRDVLHAIFAASRGRVPDVSVHGKVAFVSGDRVNEGIFPLWSIDDNVTISSLARYTRYCALAVKPLAELAHHWFDRLKIRAPSGAAVITSLSGGNQQKALIARALATEAEVILLDDPTRGVDLKTKSELYDLFRELVKQGRTLVWYSSDDEEFKECDRTLVFHQGTIVAEIDQAAFTVERLVNASFRGDAGAGVSEVVASGRDRPRRFQAAVAALIPLLTLIAVMFPSLMLNPRIVSPFGLTLVFGAALALSFASISQLFIIAAGDIDLGLGTFIGLVNAIAATWLITDPTLALASFVVLLLTYPVMGIFIDARRIPAIIVTLGLSFVWLGLASLRLPRPGGSSPDWLVAMLKLKLPLLPTPLWLCLLPAVVAYLVLFVWRYGAVLRGFGANPRAIAAAGWSTTMAKATLYGFAGLFAFLAGIIVTATTRGGDPTGSESFTLLSVAAVILGGAAFSGGLVAPIGALCGTLTLVFVGTLLSLLKANAIYLPMVQGLLLLGAVGIRVLLIRKDTR